MSKAVNTDHEFNIEKYAELLSKAQGGRTQTEFAKDCGLSVAYICKHLNKRINKAPIPSTLKKIAAVAANGITYESLLDAAGYDASKYISSQAEPFSPVLPANMQNLEFEKMATAIITSNLTQNNFKWNLIENNTNEHWDLEVEVKDMQTPHWYFSFLIATHKITPEQKNSFIKKILTCYGRLALMPNGNYIKHSFVTNCLELYDFLKDNAPFALSTYISVILIDTSSRSIVKDKDIETALSNTIL